ncbi:MAG: hypothetical protein ACTSXE_02815 [Candidatus Thorarchaeota archaeon]
MEQFAKLDISHVATAVIAFGLILDGFIKRKVPGPERGCLYGDDAHEELKRLLRYQGSKVKDCATRVDSIHDKLVELLAISRNKGAN